jgi:hypothetical protein
MVQQMSDDQRNPREQLPAAGSALRGSVNDNGGEKRAACSRRRNRARRWGLTRLFSDNYRFARRANSPQIVSLVTTGKSLAVVRASSAHQEGRFAIVTKR